MGLFGPSKKEKELENEIKRLKDLLLPEHQDIAVLKQQIALMEERKSGLEKAISDAQKTIGLENEKINNLENKIHDKEKLIFGLENDIVAQDFGIYKPTYVFAISDQYKDKLNDIRQEQKQMIRESTACSGSMSWTVDGSAAKGKKMVANMQKLLLRAFNVECDNIVDNVKISNFEKSVERISTTSEQISKLGEMMRISISPKYEKLKIEEVKLALDFQKKKQEEKEKQKEFREQQREEARVQKEIEEERKKLKKEKNHYQNALDSILEQIQKNGETQDLLEKKQEYEQHLNDTDRAISDVDYRRISNTLARRSPWMIISPSFAEPPTPHFTFKSFPKAVRSSEVPRNPVIKVTIFPPRFRLSKEIRKACFSFGNVSSSSVSPVLY